MPRLLLGLALAVILAMPASAQTFPTRGIRLVVGYSAGGGNDLIARILATKLQDKLGQPVLVDNKPGAESIAAAEYVARAAPDGYTLLMAPTGVMAINPAVHARLPYDPLRDFVPISLVAEFPLLLVVGADQPVKSVRELIDYGRANPDRARYASAATPFRLAAELFNQRTGAKFAPVEFRGSGEAVQAVASGAVLMTISDAAAIAGPLKDGKVRALAITTAKRPPAFPDVPTFGETGIADMEIALWTGIVAPAATPADIVSMLHDAIADTLAMPAVEQALENIDVDPSGMTSTEFRALIARDLERWQAVARAANVKVE